MTKIDRLIEDLKCYNDKTLVLCVSCGIDSMVLLHIFKSTNQNIIVAHVNHHMRTESDDEQRYITDYCKANSIPLEIKELHFESKANFQSTARDLRYQFFKECANKYNTEYIVTAHHANDDLETILMRLIKGSSLKGYAGIIDEVTQDNFKIIHPLLDIEKKDIIEYAKLNNIKYFDDSSNDENNYTRNRIRHNIIPYMESENPSLYKEIKEFKNHIINMNSILFDEIHRFEQTKVDHGKYVSYELSKFLEYSPYMQEQILFDLLKKYSPSKNLIKELLKQISSSKELIINNICSNFYLIKEYGKLCLGTIDKYEDVCLKIEHDGSYLLCEDINVIIDKNKCYFKDKTHEVCYNIYNLPITIRHRNDGDKIKLKNLTMSLSDYYTNKKVSHFLRNNLVIVNDDDLVIQFLN